MSLEGVRMDKWDRVLQDYIIKAVSICNRKFIQLGHLWTYRMPLRVFDPKEGRLEYLPSSSYAPMVGGCPENVKSPSLCGSLTNKYSDFMQFWRKPETKNRLTRSLFEVRHSTQVWAHTKLSVTAMTEIRVESKDNKNRALKVLATLLTSKIVKIQ